VRDHLILDLERYIPMDGELEVFDLFGVRQCRQKLNQGQQEIQIGSLKEGIYLFIIKESGRIIYQQKILKQN
ncbi:MAG: T9SS type A sorting domain-containing protein, partial [Saprospiraceae bacterium]